MNIIKKEAISISDKVKFFMGRAYLKAREVKENWRKTATNALCEQRGDVHLIVVFGLCLVGAIAVVLIHGMYTGWLPAFWSKVTGKMDSIG